jgi:YD repeat-containing protein
MSDASGSASWAYDVRGWVLTETKAVTGAGTFATSYRYDAMDRVITMTYPTGEVIMHTYNAAAQLAQVRSATHNVAYANGLTYNPLGQLTQMRLGNNLPITHTYDLLTSRLKRLQAGSLLDLSYRYDAIGNVAAITDTTNSGQVQSFGYDALDRLLLANTTSVGNGRYSESYHASRNPIGNLTARISGTLTTTYGYTDAAHKHAVTSLSNGLTFQYDANGNMTRRVELGGTQRLTYTQQWDVENRLVAVTNTVTLSVTRFYHDGEYKGLSDVEKPRWFSSSGQPRKSSRAMILRWIWLVPS